LEEPPQTVSINAAKKAEIVATNLGQLGEFAARTRPLPMGIKTKARCQRAPQNRPPRGAPKPARGLL
jgi:hypothetical protein